MSAFVVSDKLMNDTLNFIFKFSSGRKTLSSALPYVFYKNIERGGVIEKKEILKLVGDELFQENYKSVNHRYKDESNYDADFFRPQYSLFDVIDLKQFMQNLSCIEYQSCEHPEYYSSDAYKILIQLRKWACDFIPGDETKWGY